MMRRRIGVLAVLVCASLTWVAAQQKNTDWATYGLDYYEQRFSTLDQINDTNAAQLGLAWQFDTATDRGLEATPLVVDGVMYATGSWSVTYAVDARTGKQLWKYDPEVHRKYDNLACCDVVNRGLAAWEGRLYLGAYDGRLIALDARTGRKLWSVQTVDPSKPYTSTGAPRVANGVIRYATTAGTHRRVARFDLRRCRQGLWSIAPARRDWRGACGRRRQFQPGASDIVRASRRAASVRVRCARARRRDFVAGIPPATGSRSRCRW